MKKFAITLGIAIAILVSAFGISIATAKASNATIKNEDVTVDVMDLVYDDIEEHELFTNYDRVEIESVKYNATSNRIEEVLYSVYDSSDNYLGGGIADWNTLVGYI